MTTTTWKDALTPRSVDDVRADIFTKMVAGDNDVSGWPAIAPQLALVEADAAALAYETQLRAKLAALASPNTAPSAGDDWVDAKVGWFNLDNGSGGQGRILASLASWNVPLIVASAAAPLTIDNTSKIQIQANDGTIFECSQPTSIVLNAGSSFKGTAQFTARKPGTTGNVTPGQIAKVISGPAGLSIDGTGTQVLVAAARNQETSLQLIKRALGRWATQGAGWSKTSFDFLVPSFAPTVTDWRVRDDNPLGPGSLMIIMRNAAGPSLDAENAAVLAGLTNPKTKPWGTGPIAVVSATALTVSISATVASDGTNASILADVTNAIELLEEAFPIGGDVDAFLRRALLFEVLMGGASTAYGLPGFLGAKNVELTSPASDIAFALDSVISFNTSGLVIG